MAKQRNNIAKMPPVLRDVVSRMLFEGCHTQDEITAEVRREAVRSGLHQYAEIALHGTSYLAWSESDEYSSYIAAKSEWRRELERDRWAAMHLNQGSGPQSVADLAEYAILQQLHDLASGGLLETGRDVATVARAITAMQRTQLARIEAEKDDRLAAAVDQHKRETAALNAEIARLNNVISELTETRAGSRGLSDEALAEIEGRAKLL